MAGAANGCTNAWHQSPISGGVGLKGSTQNPTRLGLEFRASQRDLQAPRPLAKVSGSLLRWKMAAGRTERSGDMGAGKSAHFFGDQHQCVFTVEPRTLNNPKSKNRKSLKPSKSYTPKSQVLHP